MILALEASEITSHSGDGERTRPRIEVEERLLFDRVHIQRDRATVDERVKLAFPVLSHATDSPF